MRYQDFEDRTRGMLAGDTVSVDTAALLSSLEIGQPSRRKLWPLWSTLLLLLLVGIVWKTLPLLAGNDSSVALVEEASDMTLASLQQDDVQTTTPSLMMPVEEPTTPDKLITSAMDIDEEAVEPNDEYTATNAVSASGGNLTLASTSQDVRLNSLKLDQSTVASENASGSAVSQNSTLLVSKVEEPRIGQDGLSRAVKSSDILAQRTISNSTVAVLSRELSAVASIAGLSLAELAIEQRNDIAPPSDKIKCPSFKIGGSPWNFSIIPEIGYMVAQQDLQDLNSEPGVTTALRTEHEEALEGLQGALYGRVMHEAVPVYLKSGISYSRISHRMPLEYEYTEIDTTQGIISITESPTGDTVTTIIGDIITETMVSGNTTKHYYTHQWDLPIAVGYERPLGGFIVGIEGGINFNLRTSITGNILRTPSEFGEAVTDTDVSRRIGMGFFGGIHLGKRIDGIGEVYIAARARHIPDVSPAATNTDQSYMLYGLHAGYVHHF